MLLIFRRLIMPDPPTPPYTEATVELVAEATEQHHIVDGQTDAMGNSPCVCGQWWDAAGDNPGWDQHMAEVALNALVKAGLLLPEGAGTEWGVEVIPPDRRYQGYRVVAESEEVARGMVAGREDWKLQCRRVSDWVYAE